MNKRQQVIQAIRKQLPRLTEIKRDCEFICNEGFRNVITNVNKEGNEINVLYFSKDPEKANDYIFSYDDFEEWNFKIIGKEPTILDLLEVLRIASKEDFVPLLDCTGRLNYYKDDFYIDLSKPLVKDLDEETINFLHSVLC